MSDDHGGLAEMDEAARFADPRGGSLTVPEQLKPLVREARIAIVDGDGNRALRALRSLIAKSARDPELRWLWAVCQQQIGDLFNESSAFNSEQYLDDQIAAYEATLTVYNRQDCAASWARVQNNLGNAYYERRGEGEENIELALSAYRAALTVRTRDTDPYGWARTQNNLGNAYAQRLRGERAENQQLAIRAYRDALAVHDCTLYPRDYAMDQTNLGLTYREYVDGGIENLDRAIVCFMRAMLIPSDPRRLRRLVNSLAETFRARLEKTPEGFRGEVIAALALPFNALIQAQMRFGIADPIAAIKIVTDQADTDNGGDGTDPNNNVSSWVPDVNLFADYQRDRYRMIPLSDLMQMVISREVRNQPVLRADILRAALTRPDAVLPSFRARLSDELALALLEIRVGDISSYQEEAISALHSALEAFDREIDRREWGAIQAHLSRAFSDRISGDQAENLERAIEHCTEAIEALTPESSEWPKVMNNLGQLYRDRRLGDPDQNFIQAIASFEAALRVWTPDSHPYEWAKSQNSLGLTYLRHPRRDAQTIESAIDAFESAQTVLTRDEYPYDWAGVEFNLATAFLNRESGNRSDNIEQGIRRYIASLAERTRERFPSDWARTHHNLGQAYRRRMTGERSHNLQKAAEHFRLALEVHTLRERPADHLPTAGNLGEVEASRENWVDAHEAFASASTAADLLLARVRAGVHSFDGVVRDGHESGELDAFALAMLGRLNEAVEAVERGRTRWTAEMLIDRTASHQVSTEWRFNPDDSLGERLTAGQIARVSHHPVVYLLATPWGGLALAVRSAVSQEQPAQVISCYLPALTDNAINELVQLTLDDGTGRTVGGYGPAQEGVALNWIANQWPGNTFAEKAEHLHTACSAARVASTLDAAAQSVLQLQHPGLAEILHISMRDLDDISLSRLAATLAHTFLTAELRRCLPKLAEIAMKPLIAWLGDHNITSITFIPCGSLPAFPLTAVPVNEVVTPSGGSGSHHTVAAWKTVADCMQVTAAPSACSVLTGIESEDRSGLYALGNPRPTMQELPWAEAEALTAAALAGDPARARVHEGATLDWLIEAFRAGCIVDASCHGQFDGWDFLQSRLLLANGEDLTLADALSDRVPIAGLRLLVMSACQTGIMDLRGARGEVRSLAVGMLRAGALAVMAPLWAVDDRATYLLITRFLQEWLPVMGEKSPAEYLAHAQAWLRSVTHRELSAWQARTLTPLAAAPEDDQTVLCGVRGRGSRYTVTEAEHLINRLSLRKVLDAADEAPYADPIFWAAFQVYGH